MIETLFKRLILINDRDVADLVQLVKALDPVLDKLGELYSTFDSIRHAFNDDVVIWRLSSRLLLGWLNGSNACEQLVGTLEVATDTNATFDSNLVRGKHLLGLLNSHVLLSHLLLNELKVSFSFQIITKY